ncbi:hypothetical protein EJB05_09793 [Eragrostis curvula]|uniref:F-box domain-containing protein n=1 Tax=Eragrostis curvula TaxID=38414 RepID=A0A5J9W5V4_9POAL|nr:hypothetical protein EJB05_09793 [Eragrostis curvula]
MAAEEAHQQTQLGDLPEACLAYAIALTSPRDACRFATVSPTFRAAADSDHVWHRFIPEDHRAIVLQPSPAKTARKKDAYLGLCDGGVPVDGDDGGCRMWLDKASGAKCYALSARRLSLPWDDGEFSWRWTRHTLSRFAEVAQLVDCTCLDIYGRLPAAALTPATVYAAYLVYGTAEGHRGLSYPDQETAVALGGRVLERHRVCLRPEDDETRKFRGAGLIAESSSVADDGNEEPRRPRMRGDGWWEIEMGRLNTTGAGGELEEEEVVASFEVLGWYPKRGLIVEGIEFRPVQS